MTPQDLNRAGKALDRFTRTKSVLTNREAVARLVPSLCPLVARGESWVVLTEICRASGLPISAALLRAYYFDAVRAAKANKGGTENE